MNIISLVLSENMSRPPSLTPNTAFFLKLSLPPPVTLGMRVLSLMCLLHARLCARSLINAIPLYTESRCCYSMLKRMELRGWLICQRSPRLAQWISTRVSQELSNHWRWLGQDLNRGQTDSYIHEVW